MLEIFRRLIIAGAYMSIYSKSLAAFLFGLALSLPALVQAKDEALKRLRTVATDVQYLTTPGVPYQLSASKLDAELQGSLGAAGLRVLSKAEDANDKSINPIVRLQIQVVGLAEAGGTQVVSCAYRVDLVVQQKGRVPLNGASAPVELWRTGNVGFAGKDEFGRDIQRMVEAMIAQFVAQHKAANATK